jgi:ketosteroid isomerase-like protein
MRRVIGTTLLVLASGTACFHLPAAQHGNSSDIESVRATRGRFNDAIARHDAAAIEGFLLSNYHIVTGRSAQTHGRSAAIQDWRTIFSGDSTVIYVRTPDKILVNAEWGLAEELGSWAGHYTAPDGLVQVSGVYSAKWQRDANRRWWLQTEVFTTLECRGGTHGCRGPEPVEPANFFQ